MKIISYWHISTQTAIPIPPPMHSEATPLFPPTLLSACNNVTSIRQPEAPMRCPNAIAPPPTLT